MYSYVYGAGCKVIWNNLYKQHICHFQYFMTVHKPQVQLSGIAGNTNRTFVFLLRSAAGCLVLFIFTINTYLKPTAQ